MKFNTTARCQAGHHKQLVNVRKTHVLLTYRDLFPANPNLNPKGNAQLRLKCPVANGTSLASCGDHSGGLANFGSGAFS